ncbi:uncharacterized protein FA14DRAFT_182649 [Meira miltonrushii]|uniref:Uncharacterized protein n=1 Tax=Meira miltonrushii TaxID=1280837 RepID=A0A316V326_9BASI|nr:uncharacterized protein FA14DRAFT_182649 [Meira miltonrushii]PWN31862.1 hypothetical protein FA14DRAFT_182649 [Meira miltonrushii]
MSAQTQQNLEKDANKAKNEAQHNLKDAYEKGVAEAKDLEGRAADAAKRGEKKAHKAYDDTSKQVSQYWSTFSSDPKYWLPTLGFINVALVAGVGIFAYNNQNEVKSWDRRLVSAVSVGVLSLFGGEAYLATQKAREQTGRK